MSKIDRRQFVAALAVMPALAGCRVGRLASAHAVPSYRGRILPPGGIVPVVGIATAGLYENPRRERQLAPLRAALARFVELGGKVIDTAPSSGRAEEVFGGLIADLGARDRLYLATKVGADGLDEGKAQIEQSFRNLRTDKIDMIAVQDLRDVNRRLDYLRELQAARRIYAVGVTASSNQQYDALAAIMDRESREPHDLCVQVDYSLDNRNAAERILPLAQECGFSVMVTQPFGRGRLLSATQGKPLPGWAGEIGATTWAQVFLKYIVSHPSAPIAIPETGQVRDVEDNLGAAHGRTPDAALRTRMERFIDGL